MKDQNILDEVMKRWMNWHRGKRVAWRRISSKILQHDIIPSSNNNHRKFFNHLIEPTHSNNSPKVSTNLSSHGKHMVRSE